MQSSGRVIVGSHLFSALVNVFLPLLLARNMSAADFSQYIAVVAFAGVASLVGGLGLDRSVFRFVPALTQSSSRQPFLGFLSRVLLVRAVVTAMAIIILSSFLNIFSTEEGARLSALLPWIILATYVLSLNEIMTSSLQAMLRFSATARIMLAFSVLRLSALVGLLVYVSDISVHQALAINVVFDCGVLGLSMLVLARRRQRSSPGPGVVVPPRMSEIVRFGLANYLGYVIASAWSGPVIRLLVTASSSAGIASSYGLFQSLADRGRLFLPVGLMDRQLEPSWSADYQIRRRVARFKASAGAALKIQFFVLAVLAILFAWVGEYLISSIVRPEFGQMYWIVPLILLQLFSASVLSILWATLNAMGRADLLWRGMLVALGLVFLPLLYVARDWGPGQAVLVSCAPSVIVLGYLVATRNGSPVSIAAQLPPWAQVVWALGMIAVGYAGTHFELPVWTTLLCVPFYLMGVWVLTRVTRRPLFTRAERFLISRYFARSSRGQGNQG